MTRLRRYLIMEPKKIIFLVILSSILLLATTLPVFGEEIMEQPENQSPDTGPMAYALQFFKKTISRADGHRCMMYPSCSHYSAQAFEKHGFIKGWIMTSDRLLRCGRDEKNISENIIIDEKTYVFDPLQRNDIWWSHP